MSECGQPTTLGGLERPCQMEPGHAGPHLRRAEALDQMAGHRADQAYDDEYDCTHCGGDPDMQQCDDPLQCCNPRCDGVWHPCDACNGTGLRSNQWLF